MKDRQVNLLKFVIPTGPLIWGTVQPTLIAFWYVKQQTVGPM